MKIPIEQLIKVEFYLDERFANGDIDWSEYEQEHLELINAAGWSKQEYELEIDRRWDWLGKESALL